MISIYKHVTWEQSNGFKFLKIKFFLKMLFLGNHIVPI